MARSQPGGSSLFRAKPGLLVLVCLLGALPVIAMVMRAPTGVQPPAPSAPEVVSPPRPTTEQSVNSANAAKEGNDPALVPVPVPEEKPVVEEGKGEATREQRLLDDFLKLVGPAGLDRERVNRKTVAPHERAARIREIAARVRTLDPESDAAREALADLADTVSDRGASVMRDHCSVRRGKLAEQLKAAGHTEGVDAFLAARYAHLRGRRVFFAANLYHNEDIMDDWVFRLLQTVSALGHPERLFVSIYENGGGGTGNYLEGLEAALGMLGVPRRVVSDKGAGPQGSNRIEKLAKIREMAMGPLYETIGKADAQQFDKVVFLNDIMYCSDDLLELLHQSFQKDADITCPLDFNTWRGKILFYDDWVSRDRNGKKFRGYQTDLNQVTEDDDSNERVVHGQPFQVLCCWNGVVALNAQPFLKEKVHIRRSHAGTSECAASECSILCKDFLELGYNRFVSVPSVHVCYNSETLSGIRQYEAQSKDMLFESFLAEKPIEWIDFGNATSRAGREKVWCHGLVGNGRAPDTEPVMEQIKWGPSKHKTT